MAEPTNQPTNRSAREPALGRFSKGLLPSAAVLATLATAAFADTVSAAMSHSRQRVSVSPPVAVHVEDAHAGLCAGGLEAPASLELIPEAVVVKDGREAIEYRAEVTLDRGESAGVAWEVDVVNDRDELVRASVTAGSARVQEGETVATESIAADLADGFYAIYARAAVAAKDEPLNVLESVQYVQVADSRWSELTAEEWQALSQSRLAHPAPEAAEGVER